MLYGNTTWIADIDRVIKTIPDLCLLSGKTILITGSTGLICSSIVDVLARYNELNNHGIRIICAGRSIKKMEERFISLARRKDVIFWQYNSLDSHIKINDQVDYIIHGASNASPHMIIKEPVETLLSNIIGVNYLMSYLVKKGTGRLLFISSSEVYGKKIGKGYFKEGDYGYIDILNSRSSYSIGKKAAETLCVSYVDEYEAEAVIARPGHIYGPSASIEDRRVSSMWAFDAANGKDIVMKSEGNQIRSYCYCLDCASAILTILLKGKSGRAYNISNSNSVISINQLASIISEVANAKVTKVLPDNKEIKEFNPMDDSSLNSDELSELGWEALFDAYTGISHTIAIIKETSYEKSRII